MDARRFWWLKYRPSVVFGVLMLVTAAFTRCAPTPGVEAPTPEPIVPTRIHQPVALPTRIDDTPVPSLSPDGSAIAALPALSASETIVLDRIGIAGPLEFVEPAARLGLRSGHFTFWRVRPDTINVPGLTIWQTVRLGQIGEQEEWPAVHDVIEDTIQAHPGSFWMVGNEPDVRWQDNVTAEAYAEAYHDIYHFIKVRDPAAKVGAGGIALPTPLRLAYLDRVLEIYRTTYGEPLPVDLWSIHLFTLREESDSWGIGIPPGMSETTGQLYEIADHGNIDLIKTHIVAFRKWMAANGYGEKPLAVTEFGILLPEDYGFPPEFVQNYMRMAYDYFLSATGESGQAADGGRLVQYAFWYSLYDDGDYQTGNLFDGETGALTELGKAFIQYIDGLLTDVRN